MDISDSELIELLIAVGAVVTLFCLPACIRAWRLWHTKDPAANDPIARP
jgi:hypothetical protein